MTSGKKQVSGNMKMKIHRGDSVKIIAGKDKGKTAKVVGVMPKKNGVLIEGLNIVKRHTKPSVISPQGGITTLHKPIDISKVVLVEDKKKPAAKKAGKKEKK